MPQNTSLIGTQFVQRGKKFAMASNRQSRPQAWVATLPPTENCAQDTAGSDGYKGLRLIARLRGNRFYKFVARGQNKFRDSCRSKNCRATFDHVRTSAKRQASKIDIELQFLQGR